MESFLLLEVLGWAAFIILALMGFFMNLQAGPRAGALVGMIAGAMLAAVKGMVMFAPLFFLFPAGLVYLLTGEVEQETGTGVFFAAYALYIALSMACLVTPPVAARIIWGVLVVLFFLNITGCHQWVENIGS